MRRNLSLARNCCPTTTQSKTGNNINIKSEGLAQPSNASSGGEMSRSTNPSLELPQRVVPRGHLRAQLPSLPAVLLRRRLPPLQPKHQSPSAGGKKQPKATLGPETPRDAWQGEGAPGRRRGAPRALRAPAPANGTRGRWLGHGSRRIGKARRGGRSAHAEEAELGDEGEELQLELRQRRRLCLHGAAPGTVRELGSR